MCDFTVPWKGPMGEWESPLEFGRWRSQGSSHGLIKLGGTKITWEPSGILHRFTEGATGSSAVQSGQHFNGGACRRAGGPHKILDHPSLEAGRLPMELQVDVWHHSGGRLGAGRAQTWLVADTWGKSVPLEAVGGVLPGRALVAHGPALDVSYGCHLVDGRAKLFHTLQPSSLGESARKST